MSFSELKYWLLGIAFTVLIIGLPVVVIGGGEIGSMASGVGFNGFLIGATMFIMGVAYMSLILATGTPFFREHSKRSVVKSLYKAAMQLSRITPTTELTRDTVPRRTGGFLRYERVGDIFRIEDVPVVNGFARGYTLSKRSITDVNHPEQRIDRRYLQAMTRNLVGYAAVGMERVDAVQDHIDETTISASQLVPEGTYSEQS